MVSIIMNRKSITALAAILFASLITVSACAGIISHDETLRYKMTVTIETPEGDRVGSAVKEAVKHTEKSILPEQGGTSYQVTKGEAVVIDLGSGGKVFALQAWQGEAEIVFLHLKDPKNQVYNLPVSELPRFVYFRDMQDPKTVEELSNNNDCAAKENKNIGSRKCANKVNFEDVFGKGFFVKSVVLTRTNDPVSEFEIPKMLAWIKNVDDYISGAHISGPLLYQRLDKYDFCRGN